MKAVFLDRQTFSPELSIDTIKQQVTDLITYSLTASDQIINRCRHAEIIITNKATVIALD